MSGIVPSEISVAELETDEQLDPSGSELETLAALHASGQRRAPLAMASGTVQIGHLAGASGMAALDQGEPGSRTWGNRSDRRTQPAGRGARRLAPCRRGDSWPHKTLRPSIGWDFVLVARFSVPLDPRTCARPSPPSPRNWRLPRCGPQRLRELRLQRPLTVIGHRHTLVYQPMPGRSTPCRRRPVPHRRTFCTPTAAGPSARQASRVRRRLLGLRLSGRFADSRGGQPPKSLQRLTARWPSPRRRGAAAATRSFVLADRFRLAIVADSAETLAGRLRLARPQLDNLAARNVLEQQGIFYRPVPSVRPQVAFVFPGQGSQYSGMLRPWWKACRPRLERSKRSTR